MVSSPKKQQTVIIHTSVRTKGGGDNTTYEGALGLTQGTWSFGYDNTNKKLFATWTSTSVRLSPENSKIQLRVWSNGSAVINPDVKSKKIPPLMEEVIDLGDKTEIKKSIKIKLDEYLVFAVEGSGPAVGEIENGLAEKLVEAEATIARQKKQAAEEKALLQKNEKKKESELEQLKVQFAKERESELEQVKVQFAKEKCRLTKEIEKKSADLEELKSEIRPPTGAVTDLRNAISQAEKKVEEKQRAVHSIQFDLDRQKGFLDEEEKKLAKFKEDLEHAIKQEIEDDNAACREEVKALRDQLQKEKDAHAASITRLEQDLEAREAKVKEPEPETKDNQTVTQPPQDPNHFTPWMTTPQMSYEIHSQAVNGVAFSPDSSLVASVSHDKSVRLWNPTTGEEVQMLGHTENVMGVAFSPDGSQLASASHDMTVRLWDPSTGTEVKQLKGHNFGVNAVAFSPDSSQLASAAHDDTVRLWNATTGEEVMKLEGHAKCVSAVAFSPDGSLLASASHDETVRIWKASTGQELKTFKGHTNKVTAVAFSHDGTLLASASYDYSIRLWNLITRREVQTLKSQAVNTAVAFLPNSSLLASTSLDGSVRLWNTTTGEEAQMLKEHVKAINGVAFSPNGLLLASASDDCTIRLWNPSPE